MSSGAHRLLVIASDVADVLNLPWELMRPAGQDFLGFDARFSIRRLPRPDRLAPFAGTLPPRPLRILFMACAPQDQDPLDYEREEAFLLRAIARAMADSVTVSIFDDTIGIASASRRLSCVCVLTARREPIDERRGTSSTSSNVSAVSGRSFITVVLPGSIPPNRSSCPYDRHSIAQNRKGAKVFPLRLCGFA